MHCYRERLQSLLVLVQVLLLLLLFLLVVDLFYTDNDCGVT